MTQLLKISGFFASILLCICVSAQTTIISDDFENTPVTSFSQSFGGSILDGSPGCSQVSRGLYPDFMSLSVDMSDNFTNFLGVNPESPCGGFYESTISTGELDFSNGTDSIILTFDYFLGTDLGWGPAEISMVFVENSEMTLIDNITPNGTWSSMRIKLPDSIAVDEVSISITLGGGDAAAIDNFEIMAYGAITSIEESSEFDVSVFPNPAVDQVNWELYDGVRMVRVLNSDGVSLISIGSPISNTIDVSHLPHGSYIILLESEDGQVHKSQFVK